MLHLVLLRIVRFVFLQSRLTGGDRKAALLPKFLVCKRFYREGFHGI